VRARSLSPEHVAVPTTVCFSGIGGDAITVEESPEQILDVLTGRNGTAVLLTLNGIHDAVYINPDRIACWYPSASRREPVVVPRPFIGPV
jgi:hypothetical protein